MEPVKGAFDAESGFVGVVDRAGVLRGVRRENVQPSQDGANAQGRQGAGPRYRAVAV